MEFLVEGAPRRIDIASLVIAGWTGRDKAAVEHPIAELAAIGVRRPRLAVQGEIGGGERFEIELHDPLNDRSLRHEYATRSLAIAD